MQRSYIFLNYINKMHLFHDAREMSEWKGDMTYEKTTDAEVIKPGSASSCVILSELL